MKNKILTIILLAGSVVTLSARSTISTRYSTSCNDTEIKISDCRILTTIRVSDENGNLMSTNTISTFASGLACLAADKDGIIRTTKSLTLEGTALSPQ